MLSSGYLMASSKTQEVKLKIEGKNNILNLLRDSELNQGFYELTFKAKGKKTKIKIEIEGQKTTFCKNRFRKPKRLF